MTLHAHSHSPAACAGLRHDWQVQEALALYTLPLPELLFQAQSVHRNYFDPTEIQVSTLLNIKTGGCAENCGYCSQSAHFDTGIKASKRLETQQVIAAAKAAKEQGSTRFCMGAAWREPKERDMPALIDMIQEVRAMGMETCLTAGMLTQDQADRLKEAGLDYYNHNLDTSEAYYDKVITTRTYADRLNTLAHVREAGMKTCSGGIIGLGESREDRAALLVTLANLPEHPHSVPINSLVPVAGTPLSGAEKPDMFEFVRTIAVARLLMPMSYVRLSAGRGELDDAAQALCFMAGANSIFYGESLLTTPNPETNADKKLLERLGMRSNIATDLQQGAGRMTTPSWYSQGLDHIWPPYGQFPSSPAPLPVSHTQGSQIHLTDGRMLVDGVASWWSAAHGYNHPVLIEAAKKQLDTLPHVMFGGLAHEQAYRLATRLSQMTPGNGDPKTGLTRVFFSDSGSIATEVAMKIALQYWMNVGKRNKNRFICMHDGYHGDTMGAMAVSDPVHGMHRAYGHLQRQHFALAIPTGEYSLAEFRETLEAIASQSAALLIEPLVQGAGGVRFTSPDILAEIRRLCQEHQVLFIADEIATGFCRTGNLFACNEADIVPDILCLGKGLTGGVVGLAATLTREDIYETFVSDDPERALMHGPTYMADALACAVANASLDLFETEPRLAQANALEAQMFTALEPLSQLSGVMDVRVKGAVAAVQLAKDYVHIPTLRRQFIEHGVWIRPFRDVIYLMPPLTISESELTQLTDAIIAVTTAWSHDVREKVSHLFE